MAHLEKRVIININEHNLKNLDNQTLAIKYIFVIILLINTYIIFKNFNKKIYMVKHKKNIIC